jgi:hypothetical protein
MLLLILDDDGGRESTSSVDGDSDRVKKQHAIVARRDSELALFLLRLLMLSQFIDTLCMRGKLVGGIIIVVVVAGCRC